MRPLIGVTAREFRALARTSTWVGGRFVVRAGVVGLVLLDYIFLLATHPPEGGLTCVAVKYTAECPNLESRLWSDGLFWAVNAVVGAAVVGFLLLYAGIRLVRRVSRA